MDVFSLVATLELQADNFFSGLSDAAEAVINFASESVQTSAQFEKSMSHVRAISGQVTGTVEQQEKYMSQLISTAKEMGLQFEVGADNTTTAMNIINAKSAALGRSTQYTASEVADAFGYMAMAGWDYQEMLGGIDGVISLAAASGEELARTSDIVTDALTGFKMEASDAADFADLLAITSARANTNVSMMGETFKYVSAVAGAYGISAEDTAEAIGLMANAGVKASQAGTTLRSIFSRIGTNAGAGKEKPGALDVVKLHLGVDFYDEKGNVRDFSEFLDDLREEWQGLTTEEQANYGKIIAGQYGMAGFLALMNATDEEVADLQDSIANRTGASGEMMGIMLDNLAGDITIFQSAMDAVKRTIGEELTPTLRDFTQYGTRSLDTLLMAYGEGGLDALPDALEQVINEGSKKIEEYLPIWEEKGTKLLNAISKGIEVASPAIGSVLETVGGMIGQFFEDNAETITSTVTTVITSLTPGIIAALKGVFAGIKGAWPEISSALFEGFGDIAEMLLPEVEKIPFVGQMLAGSLKGWIDDQKTKKQLENVEKELDEVTNGLKEMDDTVTKAWDDIIDANIAVNKTYEELGKTAKGTGEQAKKAYENFLSITGDKYITSEGFTALDGLNEQLELFGQLLGQHYELDAEFDIEDAKDAADTLMGSMEKLLEYFGFDYETLAALTDDASPEILILLNNMADLSKAFSEGKITYAEFNDKATPIIEQLMDQLYLLGLATGKDYNSSAFFKDNASENAKLLKKALDELPNGEVSHTWSINDIITNYIEKHIKNGQSSGAAAGAVAAVTGPTIESGKNKLTTTINTVKNARSMFGGTILQGATFFGWDAQGRPQIGGGEGPEAVVGVNSLNQQIRDAVRDGLSGIVGSIAQAIGGRNEQPVYVVLDTGELVGAIGGKMDAELGKIGAWKSGGAA